jgi:hypothetical protein
VKRKGIKGSRKKKQGRTEEEEGRKKKGREGTEAATKEESK